MGRWRLQNALLRRHCQISEHSSQAIARCMLQDIYERILKEYQKKQELERLKRRVDHWKQNGLTDLHKEMGCTILCGHSGEELFISREELFISYRDLQRIGTFRALYQEVRTRLELLPTQHLELHFARSRRFGIQLKEHVLLCDGKECFRTLRGSIVRSIVMPPKSGWLLDGRL